ncbi:MAG: hypothetical protein ACP5JG_06440 [Anaerolineae bacterium]
MPEEATTSPVEDEPPAASEAPSGEVASSEGALDEGSEEDLEPRLPPPDREAARPGPAAAARTTAPQAQIQRTPAPDVDRAPEDVSRPVEDRQVQEPISGPPESEGDIQSGQGTQVETRVETEEQTREATSQRRTDSRKATGRAVRGLLSAEATVVSEPATVPPLSDRQPPSSPPAKRGQVQEAASQVWSPPSSEVPSRLTSESERDDRQAEVSPAPERPPEPQGLPLEEVWQVERASRPPKPPETPTAVAEEISRTRPSADEQTTAAPAAPDVQQHLERVRASRPTQSSVEVITPTRPRPATTERREIRRIEAAEAQRRRSAEPRPAVDLIATEIGPLPADLWELIEEPTPRREEIEPSPARDGTTPPSPEPATLTPPPSLPPTQTALIQRAVAPGTDAGGAEAAMESEAEPEIGGDEELGFDVEELARRVYSEIRRRLAIDKERLRPNT